MSMTTERARLAAFKRHHPDADDSAQRQALRAARATDYVQSLVKNAPPLSVEQRVRLAALLLTEHQGGDADDAA